MTIQEKCNKLNQDIHKPIFLNNYLKINSKNHEKAGHPADRKNGKEFYFIHKGANSKYDFSYAGYTPEFKSVDVDLKQFIKEQNHFTETVLDEVEKSISAQVQEDKEKFNSIKLVEIFGDLNYPINLISRAILNDYPNAMLGLGQIQESLKKLKIELNKRYNNEIPDSLEDLFRLSDYIIDKIENWIADNNLKNNFDAEIFLDSFEYQREQIVEILEEIDNEFEMVSND